MNRLRVLIAGWLVSVCVQGAVAGADDRLANPPPRAAAAFVPDPASIERYGPAYRYPQAGWIVLHIEGEPYERGYQHGRLLAPEIAATVKASATKLYPKGTEDGWQMNRMFVDALFLRRYDPEYVLEMKGIADGAAQAGARFDGRPIDLLDIVCVNSWTEIEFLDAAVEATPKGIEGVRFRDLLPTRPKPAPPSRCSAFIATAPATRDGKIVFGHITMWSLYSTQRFNVWLDVRPAKGHRVLMQTYPGGIQSSMDYYFNDAGLLVAETTLGQTRFHAAGETEASRIRRALQYAHSIDTAVEILKTANNGLYTNEWLIGDTKTNEIAMFELGTFQSKLYRSNKNEWFGNTAGFYWGCNNAKDLAVRLETLPSLADRPANVVFRPSDRDIMWQRLYAKHRGRIDEAFGFEAFATPPLAAAHSLDAKFTTTDMAGELKTWALFGPPLGRTWEPTPSERSRYPDIQPLISNGWTLLDAKAPPKPVAANQPAVVDLASSLASPPQVSALVVTRVIAVVDDDFGSTIADGPAWRGTILPQEGGDLWLAAAFADYERIVANEKASGRSHATWTGSLGDAAAEATHLALFGYRTAALAAARSLPDVSLAGVSPRTDSNDWYHLAAGRGVHVLAELRALLGERPFERLMDEFGREFAGKPVSTAEFRARAERVAGRPLDWFFEQWLASPALPSLRLHQVTVTGANSDWQVRGVLAQGKPAFRARVEVSVETDDGTTTQLVPIGETPESAFQVSTTARPRRLVVDPRGRLLKTNGGVHSVRSFERELEQTLIVYGTGSEAASLREAAELLQRRIATGWSNFTVPMKADREVTDDDLKNHHLLLVGRPTMNSLAARFADVLPVHFGSGSFTVADRTYAHPASAIVAAAANPTNARYSLVVVAGLSAESTRRVANLSPPSCEIFVWPAGAEPQALALPARELVVQFAAPK